MFEDIKAFLFDKDGTLFNYAQMWGPLYLKWADLAARGDKTLADKLLEVGGFNPRLESYDKHSILVAGVTDEIVQLWAPMLSLAPDEQKELCRHLDNLTAENAKNVGPAAVTNLPRFFASLKESGFGVGVATNDSEASAITMMTTVKATRLLDFIVGYDSGFGIKPNPGMILAFAQSLGLEPCQIAMVGDTNHDMETGLAAGVGKCVGVLTGLYDEEDFIEGVDLVIPSIENLLELV